MVNFVNISGNDKQQLLVNKDDISCVVETISGATKAPQQATLSFSSFDFADTLRTEIGRNTDASGVVRALEEVGTPLFELPYTSGDQVLGRFFINPKAFNYITVSKPYIPSGKTTPHVAIVMGIDGRSVIESSAVLPEDLEKFLDAVYQIKPGIRFIDHTIANARFFECSYAAYDPEKVIRIYRNGHQVNVKFENGGVLDFNMPNRDWVDEYINRKFNLASNEQRQCFRNRAAKSDLNAMVYGFEERIKARIQRAFARKIAAGAPHLTRIEKAMEPLYLRFNNVSFVNIHEHKSDPRLRQKDKILLTFQFKAGTADGRGMSDYAACSFRSFADAELALRKLQGQQPAPRDLKSQENPCI